MWGQCALVLSSACIGQSYQGRAPSSHTHKEYIQTQVLEKSDVSLQVVDPGVCEWITTSVLTVEAIYNSFDQELMGPFVRTRVSLKLEMY